MEELKNNLKKLNLQEIKIIRKIGNEILDKIKSKLKYSNEICPIHNTKKFYDEDMRGNKTLICWDCIKTNKLK